MCDCGTESSRAASNARSMRIRGAGGPPAPDRPRRRQSGLLLDAVEVIDSAKEQAPSGDAGRRPAHFADVIRAEQLKFGSRLDHKRLPVLIEAIDLAVASPRR